MKSIVSLNQMWRKINRRFNRFKIKYSRNKFPNSYPFISGDTFRGWANFIFDRRENNLIPQLVGEGDIIFVQTDYLDQFFLKYHGEINFKYILISHNSDDIVDKRYIKYIDEWCR